MESVKAWDVEVFPEINENEIKCPGQLVKRGERVPFDKINVIGQSGRLQHLARGGDLTGMKLKSRHAAPKGMRRLDRMRVVLGTSVSVREDLGGSRVLKNKTTTKSIRK